MDGSPIGVVPPISSDQLNVTLGSPFIVPSKEVRSKEPCPVWSGQSLRGPAFAAVGAGSTISTILSSVAHCPVLGVNVIKFPPVFAILGSNVLPEVPVPDQIPEIPPGLVVKFTIPSVLQNGEPGSLIVRLTVGVTKNVKSTLWAHSPGAGSKVIVFGPAVAIEGTNSFAITVAPVHEPVIPLYIVPKLTLGSSEQILGFNPVIDGIISVLTVIFTGEVTFTHSLAAGVNVIGKVPAPEIAGSKVFPLTPVPPHVPAIPPGVVVSVNTPSEEHKSGKGPNVTFVAVFTITLIGGGVFAHSLTSGVKVKLVLPPLGSKLFPVTPGPLQDPITPSCVVFKATAASFSQNGPIGESAGVVFIQVIVILEKVTDSLAAQV